MNMKENFKNNSPTQHTPKFNNEASHSKEKGKKENPQVDKLKKNKNNYF